MVLSISTNNAALNAAASVYASSRSMETSMERLSTGKRINSASDDAAAVAIASRMTSEIMGTNQSIRNALDGQALINTIEGAHKEVSSILQRMRELAVQAANGTNSQSDRANLQTEYVALISEVDRIASVTTWAGSGLMSGTNTFSFQVGSATGSKNQISVTTNDMKTNGTTALDLSVTRSTTIAVSQTGHTAASKANNIQEITLTSSAITAVGGLSMTATASAVALAKEINEKQNLIDVGISASVTSDGKVAVAYGTTHGHLLSTTGALEAVKNIDSALTKINTQRASLGAVSNRLSHSVSNLTNISANLSASRGTIEDADFAKETTNLAKDQILQQAATAMLAQANASKQIVLGLLRT